MAAKIFYRERRKVSEGEKKPRFRVVATVGSDLHFHSDHMRKSELEQIASQIGAELILLEHGKDGENEEVEV